MDALAGLRLRAGTVAQVLVESLDQPVLTKDDHHHLDRVLRVRDGERVSLIDGTGAWRLGAWQGGTVVSVSEVAIEPPSRDVAVAFPPLKGDRTELVVQKLTELGVARIVLLSVDNAVVQWKGDKSGKVMERLSRIAHEASMQSRRTRLPVIEGLLSVADAVAQGFVLAQWGGGPAVEHHAIAVGPEGGWSPAELAMTNTVSLGSTVLRAETAAIAAGVLLTH